MRFVITSLFIFISLAGIGQSAFALDEGGLVTCDGTGINVERPGEAPEQLVNCSFCKFMEMVEKVVNFIVVILILLSVIMLAITGIQMAYTASGGTDARQLLKDRMTNIVIGFFLIIAAWTIVDTMLKALVTDGQIRDHWRDYLSSSVSDLCFEPLTPQPIRYGLETIPEPTDALSGSYSYVDPVTGFITTVPAGDASIAGAGLTDAQVKALLDGAGIEYKDSVSGAGLKQHVIDELINLNAACGCDITITSLTDGSHAGGTFSHANGFKADLRSTGGGNPNPRLMEYVRNLPSAGSWSDGTPLHYDAEACATYAIEGDHIDVQYKTGC